LSDLTAKRVLSNKACSRLYPVLAEGIIDLVNEKLRWSHEEVEILPQSVHGILKFEDLGATIRIEDAISARVKGDYIRVVYPYFSEVPGVISPFLTGCIRRIHAAIFSFMAGVIPPMPMLGRSLLYVQSHFVACSCASSMLSMMYWSSHSCLTVRL
jgi:hypothetical protein